MRGNAGKGEEDNESRNENAVYNMMIAATLVITCFGDG
jgi:hypothetical protein